MHDMLRRAAAAATVVVLLLGGGLAQAAGGLVWATRAGGTGNDAAYDVAALADGTTFTTGYFAATATFGSGEAHETRLVSVGEYDMFLARHAPDGTLVWATKGGGTGATFGLSVAARADGSSAVGGTYIGAATFGAGELNEITFPGAGSNDAFVARYNADGTLVWARAVGGAGYDCVWAIAILADGTVLAAGSFEQTVTFGAGEAHETTLTSAGSYDLFLARYNADGTLAWVKTAGSTDFDYPKAIAVQADDSVWLTGQHGNGCVFGAGEAGETALASGWGTDIFVARYTPDGKLVWARTVYGDQQHDAGEGIAVLADGSSIVTGWYYRAATFDLGGPAQVTLASPGNSGTDGFVAKYDANGALLWAKQIACAGSSGRSLGVVAFADGSSVITGYFGSGTATFGPSEPGETVLTSYSEDWTDAFLAGYRADGTLAWARGIGGAKHDYAYGLAAGAGLTVFCTGSFQDRVNFAGGPIDATALASAGSGDVFVAKFATADQSVSGTVTDAQGVPLADVVMNGLPGNPVTGADGTYSAAVAGGWSGTVTPQKAGLVFAPASRVYAALGETLAQQDYTGGAARTISGYVKQGSKAIANWTITGLPGNPKTNAQGFYTAAVPLGWSGTAAPQTPGGTFTPVSRQYVQVSTNLTKQNYAAQVQTVAISGKVATHAGVGVAGVKINGLPGNVTTDAAGNYSVAVQYGWAGTATPQKFGYRFDESWDHRDYVWLTTPQVNQDYEATPTTVVSGYVRLNGRPLAGVQLFGLLGSPFTPGTGYYSVVIDRPWSETVTPLKAGYDFTPARVVYTNVNLLQLTQNYTAKVRTFTISGTVKTALAVAMPGVRLVGLPSNPTTNAQGYYSATVPYGWAGTVTPQKTGATFTPPSMVYAAVTAAQPNQNYVAAQPFTISGFVKQGAVPVAGVLLNGLPGNPTTNALGFYTVSVDYGWSGTVTPQKQGLKFSPLSRVHAAVTANRERQNYAASTAP